MDKYENKLVYIVKEMEKLSEGKYEGLILTTYSYYLLKPFIERELEELWRAKDVIIYSIGNLYIAESMSLQGAVLTRGSCLRSSSFKEIERCVSMQKSVVI